jgi:hypothetical protein
MKKIVLTSMAMALGAVLAHAQGTITISSTVETVETNGAALGAAGGTGWTYEVLDMTSTAYNALNGTQQTGLDNLLANESDFSLWTDSGVSGIGQNLASHAGGINSSGSATAANWAAPTSNSGYNTAASYDYYTVLGWNASLGSWLTVSNDLSAGDLSAQGGNWFGQSGVAYNYAGGAGLSPVDLFGPSGTGLAGSGGLPTVDAITLNPIPEPTTLALAGLGGISMLFLRRRKA